MPTLLAAALMVFMRICRLRHAADDRRGLPNLPVETAISILAKTGQDHTSPPRFPSLPLSHRRHFPLIQQLATSRHRFSINALHPIDKESRKGISDFLMHLLLLSSGIHRLCTESVCVLSVLPQLPVALFSLLRYLWSIIAPPPKLPSSQYCKIRCCSVVALAIIVLSVLISSTSGRIGSSRSSCDRYDGDAAPLYHASAPSSASLVIAFSASHGRLRRLIIMKAFSIWSFAVCPTPSVRQRHA